MTDAPEESQEPGAPKEPQFKEVSETELKRVLAEHEKWVRTAGKEGALANLSGAELQGADLIGAQLQGADLHGAKLQGAYLIGAQLQGVTLSGANLRGADLLDADLREAYLIGAQLQGAHLFNAQLQGAFLNGATFERRSLTKDGEPGTDLPAADLTGADLSNADLSDARLADVTGLLAEKLAGANLSNAKLPEDIAAFEGLAHVMEISKHARGNFLAVVGGCIFSWLTIGQTTDVALLTGSSATPLPIIQTPVPIAGFYWAAPAILLTLYLYLHLYLQRMWEGLASLPAIFPAGRSLDQRAYPWLLSGLASAYVPLLKYHRPTYWRLQVGLSIVGAWMLVPFTLFLFWGRYLPRHDWPGTLWQGALMIIAIAMGAAFYRRAKATLRGEHRADRRAQAADATLTWKKAFRAVRSYRPERMVVLVTTLTVLLSLGAIEGSPRDSIGGLRRWIPSPYWLVGYHTFADLREAEISTRPEDWWRADEKNWWETDEENRKAFAGIKGANLSGLDLRYAEAAGVFLANADLHGADLQGAKLSRANLQGADLYGADLQGAILFGAKLQGADLSFANLTEAEYLTQQQLDEACGNKETRLPVGLTIRTCL